MKYKAVLFDLDGTLLDTLKDLGESMNKVLKKFGFPVFDIEDYKYFVGEGIETLVRKVLPETDRDLNMIKKCLCVMRSEYGRHWADNTKPYRNISKLLDKLEQLGFRKAILSNKPDNFTKLIAARLLSAWKFDCVLGAKPSVPVKPDPQSAIEIARALNVSTREFLYLGDTSIDMKTARASGMYPVGVLWGFRKADELLQSGAKILIDDPLELLEIL